MLDLLVGLAVPGLVRQCPDLSPRLLQSILVLLADWCKDVVVTQNGRPSIDNTGARVRGQATNGYAPPGRNFPISGCGTTSEIEDPFVEQDSYLDALEDAEEN
jgi:hypothetical protein